MLFVLFVCFVVASSSARGSLAYSSKATLASLELLYRFSQVNSREVRPHAPSEVKLRIRAFPEKEITQSLLATGADEKVHVS